MWAAGCPPARAHIGRGGQLWASAMSLPGVVAAMHAGLEIPNDATVHATVLPGHPKNQRLDNVCRTHRLIKRAGWAQAHLHEHMHTQAC